MLLRYSLILAMLTGFSANVMALEITPGEWELTVKQNVSGMPIGVPTQKHRECFSDDDPIPISFLKARQCDVIKQHVRHRTVYFKINCFTENGSIINEGKIKFSSQKISGDSKTDLGEVAGLATVLGYKFTGRRIGECSLK